MTPAGAERLEAAAALYAGARLERLGVLQVTDRLVELYLAGGLPVGSTSSAAALLDAYWVGSAERLGAVERRALYGRVFGPGFEHLWERLLAALAAADADARGDCDDDVAWAAGELRANLDAHLDDGALGAVALLHAQLADALAILAAPEVLEAYGARDPWQLVDRLARLELGELPDVARLQTQAASGAAVLGWLAEDTAARVTDEVVDAALAWLDAARDRDQ